jgi:hypothetical protein
MPESSLVIFDKLFRQYEIFDISKMLIHLSQFSDDCAFHLKVDIRLHRLYF